MARTARIADIPTIGTLHRLAGDRSAGSLSRQLAQALREAVRNGDLQPGEALPSTRLLAASLQVARGTVIEAYEQLLAEGFLESKGGAGTWVAQALAEPHPASETPAAPQRTARTGLPASAAAFAQIAQEFRPLPAVPFAISVPVGLTAPADIWRRLGNAPRGPAPRPDIPIHSGRCRYARRLPTMCASRARYAVNLARSL